MNNLTHAINDYLISLGVSDSLAKYINMFALLLIALIIIYFIDFLIKKLLLNTFAAISSKSKSNFDDLLIKNRTPRKIAHIVPLILAYKFIPIIFVDFQELQIYLQKIILIFSVFLILITIKSFLDTLRDYFKTLSRLKDKPINSFIQVIMIFAWITGIIFIIVIITDISVWKFITAMGAASAVILLIFKDTIMGFVASIQVSINDMVRIGDWITFEKYGADGDVTEINLATVKVQNFDKTITTIPTYALISDSFKNWRGMNESGGRRLKRALNINLSSVKYLTDNEIDKLKKIELIKGYLETRQNDINQYNKKTNINKEELINGRNLTNIGVFRKYIEVYLENHSAINKDMMIMARQLAPTTQGIPIEIYAFSSDKRWKNYEYIMSDIFDHIIAAIPYFNLEIFELPDNSSFKN